MQIIKKETIEFGEREIEAIGLVIKICSGIDREATDPDLQILAKKLYSNLSELEEWMEC